MIKIGSGNTGMSINKMKKYLFIVLLVGFICGQNNNAYAEFGGAGYTMTFNYERMLTENIIVRVGYGSNKQSVENGTSKDGNINFFPLGATYLVGSGKQKMEIGVGVTMLKGSLVMDGEYLEPNEKMFFLGGGYRYHIGESGLLLSLKGYYLFLAEFSAPWAGMSVGWTF